MLRRRSNQCNATDKEWGSFVAGMSLKDPAMMWRNIFGRLYNYAQDTVIGLQDMAWIWEISGDNWWESYVAWSAENGAYNSIREDFSRAAGGQ